MKSLALTILLAILVGLAGCQPKDHALSADLKMSDRSSASQLIMGFYGVEHDQWRWTAHRFAVVLPPPSGSERSGARLRLQLYIPDSQIKKLGPMTLTADVGDVSLGSETFTDAGAVLYSRDVPAGLLVTELLPVVFTFNKAAAASNADRRELAAVVTEVSLERSN